MVWAATENDEGVFETPLNCPQCGCGEHGLHDAVNLNDLIPPPEDN